MRIRTETLTASGAGMTRLRTKGAASKETLYELTNGYISASRAPTMRPGTTWKSNVADPFVGSSSSNFIIANGPISFTMNATVSSSLVGLTVRATSSGSGAWMQGNVTGAAGLTLTINITSTSGSGVHNDWNLTCASFAANAGLSKGLASFKGNLYTFSHTPLTTPSPTLTVLTLRHPTSQTAALTNIHFVQPFMGFLYVVAQFAVTTDYPSGFIGHYWLQNPPAWKAGGRLGIGTYKANTMVQPTVPNGFYYKCVQLFSPPAWAPLLQYALSDIVQPTVYNGYFFLVFTETGPGTPPARAGSLEPAWSTNQFTLEFSTSAPPPAPAVPPVPRNADPPGLPGDGTGRYNNRFGPRRP